MIKTNDAILRVLKEVAEELYGSMAQASRAAGRSKDTLSSQIRGSRSLTLRQLDSYLTAWGYPTGAFVARLDADAPGLGGRQLNWSDVACSFLDGLVAESLPSAAELRQALKVADESRGSAQYLTDVPAGIRDVQRLKFTDRHRALLLANRMLGELAVDDHLSHQSSYVMELALVLTEWASVNRTVGKYREAALALRHAHQLTRRYPLSQVRANSLRKTAMLLGDFGAPEQGIILLDHAARIHSLGGCEEAIHSVFLGQGLLHSQTGQVLEATALFGSVLSSKGESLRLHRCGALHGLGNIHLMRNDADRCRVYLEQIYSEYDDLEGLLLGWVLWLDFRCTLAQGDLPKALQIGNRLWSVAVRHFEPHDVFAVFVSYCPLLWNLRSRAILRQAMVEFRAIASLLPESISDRILLLRATNQLISDAQIRMTERLQARRALVDAAGRLCRPASWN